MKRKSSLKVTTNFTVESRIVKYVKSKRDTGQRFAFSCSSSRTEIPEK
jgi:hypothetical protein